MGEFPPREESEVKHSSGTLLEALVAIGVVFSLCRCALHTHWQISLITVINWHLQSWTPALPG